MDFDYNLRQLFVDQDPDFIADTMASLVCWLAPKVETTQPVSVTTFDVSGGAEVAHNFRLSWDEDELGGMLPGLRQQIDRYRSRRTAQLEDLIKLGAYGLAMIATSCLLKERVATFNFYAAPDLVLKPNGTLILRGVEVAGRSSGGRGAFTTTMNGATGTGTKKGGKAPGKPGKRAQIVANGSIHEAWVSLWCQTPSIAHWEKIKP